MLRRFWRKLGELTRRYFERRILEPVAVRASRRLIEEGTLEQGDLFYFTIEIAETKIGPLVIEGAASPPVTGTRLLPHQRRELIGRPSEMKSSATTTFGSSSVQSMLEAMSSPPGVGRWLNFTVKVQSL